MSNRTAVISIHPYHANRIYSGKKRIEFRRRASGLKVFDRLLIYETRPVSLITGEAIIEAIHVETFDDLCMMEPDFFERNCVARYLNGSRSPVGLGLAGVLKYKVPIKLSGIGLKRTPQSYQFVGS